MAHAKLTVLVAVLLAACARGPACPDVARPDAPAAAAATAAAADGRPASALSPERRAYWRAIHDAGNRVPDGANAVDLLPELEAMLADPDPEVRDDLALGVFEAWIVAGQVLDAATLRGLAGRLVARLAPGAAPGETDAVFGRSFAALVLGRIVRRDLDTPFLDDAGLDALLGALTTYAAAEHDLRGYVPGRGWAHAAAHTADALAVIGRHPRLTTSQAEAILDAVLALSVRRHGYNLHHGEDSRLVQPVLAVVRHGLVDGPPFATFLASSVAPLGEAWPTPFDPALYAAQRNARNLLYTLVVALSFEPADDAHAAAALVQVRATLGG